MSLIQGPSVSEDDVRSLSALLLMGQYVASNPERFAQYIEWIVRQTHNPPPTTIEENRQFSREALADWSRIQKDMIRSILIAKEHAN